MSTIRHRVRRCAEGWLAIVLVGERTHKTGPYQTKREARRVAREWRAAFGPTE